MALEAAIAVALLVGRRASLITVPDRNAFSRSTMTVEVEELCLIMLITYFANTEL